MESAWYTEALRNHELPSYLLPFKNSIINCTEHVREMRIHPFNRYLLIIDHSFCFVGSVIYWER